VIVGAGCAGCTLAARLSEDPERRVTLLEAGPAGFPERESEPGTAFSDDVRSLYWNETAFTGFARHGWTYPGFAYAGDRHPLLVARGRVLGGSSATNGAAWLRGTPAGYDAWGSPLWTYEALLPSFRRSESDPCGEREFHGDDGPVPVERVPFETWWPFHRATIEGLDELGFGRKPDINDPVGSGSGPVPRNMVDAMRVSAAAAYLRPARGRPNLEIRVDAPVTRILLRGNRATGVELRGGEKVEAGEVLLCAGTLESPHLLMLSGIGAGTDLAAAGIEARIDLPGVGQNLRDHAIVSVAAEVDRDGEIAADGMAFPAVLHYTATGSDALNDMQLMPSYPLPPAAGARTDRVSIDIGLQLPVGAGRLDLDPTDPAGAPRINFNYLAEAEDRRRFVDALRLAARILETEPCRALGARRLGPHAADYEDDAALEAWTRANLVSAFHSSGTCKLGPVDDEAAVVDERCRVHGVASLRVVDLSIAPVSIGNAAASAIAIGERAAELIDRE
jgi:choline dehydrogenase-like flavoprotein